MFRFGNFPVLRYTTWSFTLDDTSLHYSFQLDIAIPALFCLDLHTLFWMPLSGSILSSKVHNYTPQKMFLLAFSFANFLKRPEGQISNNFPAVFMSLKATYFLKWLPKKYHLICSILIGCNLSVSFTFRIIWVLKLRSSRGFRDRGAEDTPPLQSLSTQTKIL